MKILITGATGVVGGHVARLLSDVDHPDLTLRALVRDPAKAATIPALAGVELIAGDLTDANDVRSALAGVDRAFLNMADDDGAAFIPAAGELGLGHLVLLSSFSAVTELPSGQANIVSARHRAGEAGLREAGVPSTFLRAAGFDYNIGMWLATATDGVVKTPFPDVALPVVHPGDIAAAAVAVLLAEAPQPGTFSITGPTKVTLREQVSTINTLLGRSLQVQEVTFDEAKALAFPAGTPDFVSTSVLETMSPAAAVVEPSGDVDTLTGRPARTFGDWAEENRAAFA